LVHSFFDWFEANALAGQPWLILGKGPSFARRGEFDLSRFRLMSLNHAAREQAVLAAHVIDLDVIDACAGGIEQNARFLVMPWYPHVHNVVGKRTLAEIVAVTPVLQQFERQGRLLWYDLSTSPVRHGSAPVVEATYFSAEAALNLLATAGARCVRSLGIDGGSSYSSAFDDLRDTTLLANGRTSFDLQFEGFARTINRTGIDFYPLDQPGPARVLSAYKPNEVLPVAVLHHSIRRRASFTVDTVAVPDGSSASAQNGRVLIVSPRAQFQTDLRKLWGTPVPDSEAAIPADPLSSGSPALLLVGPGLDQALPKLASCIRVRAPLETLTQGGAPEIRSSLPKEWDPGWPGEPEGNAPVLYYAPDGSEPWLSRKHPLGHLWMGDLLDAVARGHVRPDLVAREVALGHVRPSLLYQVENGLEEPLLLPARARYLDRNFRPAAQQNERTPPVKWGRLLAAFGRQLRRWSRGLRAGVAAPR
jgi:hypothetical protein